MRTQILLFLMFCSTCVFCQEVTEELAVEMANHYSQMVQNDYFAIQKAHISSQDSLIESRLPEYISPSGKAKMWLVPIDDGWVLISNTLKATPILAHIQSYDKPIYDSLPDGAKELWSTFEDYLLYVNKHEDRYEIDRTWLEAIDGKVVNTNITNLVSKVEPLLNSQWAQSGGGLCYANQIYNKFCPTVNNSISCGRAPAGCVAVAVAQIMRYWNWPYAAQVPTTIGGNSTSLMFYDWDKMPTSINVNTPIDEVDMIAGLLRDCGYKLNTNYGENQSSATNANAEKTFKAFGYDESTINLRSKWSTTGWTNMLHVELAEGRPVYYSGRSKTIGGSGHAFVVDGFNEAGLYHINWGWDGWNNGWYNIDDAFINDTLHFEHTQAAIFGIRPSPSCTATLLNSVNSFPSKFCHAIGGKITISNVTIENIVQGEIYSSTQVKLSSGVRIKQGSNVHIAIKPIPCPTTSSNAQTIKSAPANKVNGNEDISRLQKSFTITPNPTHDILVITTTEDIESVNIYNISGQCVLQTMHTKINVSTLPLGSYILHAKTTKGELYNCKFIKQ